MKKLKTRQSGAGPGITSQYLIDTGTWTPFIVSMDYYLPADVTYATNGQIGTWQRIGTWVYYSCNITLTSNGTDTGFLFIGGLPFEHYYNDDDYMDYNAAISKSNLPAPTTPKSSLYATSYAYFIGGVPGQGIGSGIQICYNDGTYATQAIPINTLPDTFYINLTGMYRTYPNATQII